MKKNFLISVVFFMSVYVSSCSTTDSTKKMSSKEILDAQKSVVVGYLDRGQAQSAHKELRSLLASNSEDPDLHNLMGLANLALNNKKRALVHFRKSYEIQKSVPIALNLSSCLVELGKYKEAKQILMQTKERGLENYPYPERLEHNLGLVHEKLKLNDSAEKYYTAALAENPAFYLSLIQLGKLYLNQNRMDQASSKLKLANAACPVCYDAVDALVEVHKRQKQFKEARDLLANYLRNKNLNPDELARAQTAQSELSKTASLNGK